ncbi:MAG: hypothetical protein ABFE01_11575 [Phycisphaerales bacterium]
MEKRCCRNCVYGKRPEGRWLRVALSRWPGMVICSVCADRPGKTCGVYTESCCRNFCPKPGVACEPHEIAVTPGEKFCKIPLTRGLFAIVDPEDYEELNKHKWCATVGKHTCYACRGGSDGKLVFMHRVVMKTPPDMIVDHINLDGLDNRKRFLRNCTQEQNSYNRAPHRGATGFKGVRYHEQNGKYKSLIRYKGKDILIGWFDDPIEAAKARDRKAWELQGEFAYLNFPDELAQWLPTKDDAGPCEVNQPRYVDFKGVAVVHAKAVGGLLVTPGEGV